MMSTIRKNSADQVFVIAGGDGWAYDSDTLVTLDGQTDESLIMYNFHPYMGPNQQGDKRKAADGFE
jgi:hypothetical protein